MQAPFLASCAHRRLPIQIEGHYGRAAFVFFVGVVLHFLVVQVSAQDTKGETKEEVALGGAPAPLFELEKLQPGQKLSLSGLRGKWVLINFWATWCQPCVKEMPALERLSQMIGRDKFEVIAINTDEAKNRNNVLSFVDRYGITFTVLIDPDNIVAEKYGVTGFPETFFVSPEGNFASFSDPTLGVGSSRIISDRPWDNTAFVRQIMLLIDSAVFKHDASTLPGSGLPVDHKG